MRPKYRYILLELDWAPAARTAAPAPAHSVSVLSDLSPYAIVAAVREALDAIHGQFAVAATQSTLTGLHQCSVL